MNTEELDYVNAEINSLEERLTSAKRRRNSLKAKGKCTFHIMFNGDRVISGTEPYFVAATVWRTNELPGQLIYVGKDPDVVKAAAEALEAAGFGVSIRAEHNPPGPLG